MRDKVYKVNLGSLWGTSNPCFIQIIKHDPKKSLVIRVKEIFERLAKKCADKLLGENL